MIRKNLKKSKIIKIEFLFYVVKKVFIKDMNYYLDIQNSAGTVSIIGMTVGLIGGVNIGILAKIIIFKTTGVVIIGLMYLIYKYFFYEN